jgi:serine/threonine-protein kinase
MSIVDRPLAPRETRSTPMTQRQTSAYPPRPAKPEGSDTQAPTLMAPPAKPESQQATLAADPSSSGSADSMQATLAADGSSSGGAATLPPTGSSRASHITVLPEVRADGEQLVVVPRERVRYEGDRLLGRGGMGEVKLAQDHDIGRRVAVKRLLDEQNPHALARFIDEVRTVGSLEHPNIVPIHDVGVDENGSLFFVMKYVEGETLATIIDKLAADDPDYHRRYTVEKRLDLFTGLVHALDYAHGRGLVHRDVKPENVMVGEHGEVILMDWGIAHRMRNEALPATTQVDPNAPERASSETVDGSVVGTPQYMSPEQAAGEVASLDGSSDLYSAFTVLFELLLLRPYVAEGKSAMQTVLAVQEKRFPSMIDELWELPGVSQQGPLPAELRHFLRHGLGHDKSERYQSADEVLYTLDRIRSGDFKVECMVTYMKHKNRMLSRFMDRHPLGSMVLAAGSSLAFIGGLAGWLLWALG